MTPEQIQKYGDELYAALRARTTVSPLTKREPGITVDDAYRVSRRMVDLRIADGEAIIGKKIGVTSLTVQRMLDVHTPDFGWLTDRMRYDEGDPVPIGDQLIQPRAEGEIAFLLGRDLEGPGVTPEDVVRATECVMPCFEIVDSRIADWKIAYEDTVADNASSGVFLLGADRVAPGDVDFSTCAMTVEKNGAPLSSGSGADALGSPLNCVAWLANKFGELGVPLEAGEVILSGSLVPLEPVRPGDHMRMHVPGVGTAEVRFI